MIEWTSYLRLAYRRASPAGLFLRRPSYQLRRTQHFPSRTNFSNAGEESLPPSGGREILSPLGAELVRQIKFLGPLTVAQYMRSCLTHPKHGYYSAKQNVLGSRGDFITAPEVSQVFGELVAVWIAHVVSQMDTSRGYALAELGPGNGTMMKDIIRSLRALRKLPKQIHLVEASTALRNVQKEALADIAKENAVVVQWHQALDNVPDFGMCESVERAVPTIYVAQEFFDALPVHVFQSDESYVMRERLVDICRDDVAQEMSLPYHFRYVLAPGDTPAKAVFGSRYLPSDKRGKEVLKSADSRAIATHEEEQNHASQSVVEVCAEGVALAEMLAERVSRSGGAALIIDYGYDEPNPVMKNTLRAVRQHGVTSALSMPGISDVTADVNFAHLRDAVQRSGGEFYGSTTQRDFLFHLGIAARFRVLARTIVDNPNVRDIEKDKMLAQLQKDYDRLTNADEMGEIYRVAAILHRAIKPIGF